MEKKENKIFQHIKNNRNKYLAGALGAIYVGGKGYMYKDKFNNAEFFSGTKRNKSNQEWYPSSVPLETRQEIEEKMLKEINK